MIATTGAHLRAVCHGRRPLAAGLVLLALVGCAPSQGWARSESRVCAADSPAVVCVQAWPDRAVELDVGGAAVLPGECVVAPRGGGSLRVHWRDANGGEHLRRIRAGARQRTELALGADRELHVTARHACGTDMPPYTVVP